MSEQIITSSFLSLMIPLLFIIGISSFILHIIYKYLQYFRNIKIPNKIIIDGHLKWIIPLFLVIATAFFTLHIIYPSYEYFSNQQELENFNLQLNEKVKIKENFETYTSDTEILPKKIKKYNFSIKGYNFSEYSENNLDKQIDNSNYKFDDINNPIEGDYIFPEKDVNKTNCIKYASSPNILGYENDVNKKILSYESSNILNNYKPEDLNFDRPQFMYNKRSGIYDQNSLIVD